jgi:hypothetical protein
VASRETDASAVFEILEPLGERAVRLGQVVAGQRDVGYS